MASALAICRSYKKLARTDEAGSFQQLRSGKEAEISRLRTLAGSVPEPRVRSFASDLATMESTFMALSSGPAPRISLAELRRLRSVNEAVRTDEETLGIVACVGPLPHKPVAP